MARKTRSAKTPARKSAPKAAANRPAGKTAAARRTPARKPRAARKGPAVKALEAELAGALAPMAETALAASAMALARQLDKPKISATATASCSRALLDTLDRLRALVPPKEDDDGVETLRARRAARRGDGGAGT